jgi:hypothetical protein
MDFGGGGGGGGRELRLFSPILFLRPFEPSRTILNLRLKNNRRILGDFDPKD